METTIKGSKCDKCDAFVSDIDAVFSPAEQQLDCECGGKWQKFMKTKHTPGPYQAYDWFSDSNTRWACVCGDTDGASADFRIEFDHEVSEKEQEATVEFIVKSCNAHYDLLKACKLLLTANKNINNFYHPKILLESCEMFKIAEVAIAKAEGK